MKAYEIALFIIILSASIGFMNNIGVFGIEQQTAAPESEFTERNISNLENLTQNQSEASVLEKTTVSIHWLFRGLSMMLDIVGAIFFLYPTLDNVFGIPGSISALLQSAIWVVYVVGIVQIFLRSGFKYYE